MTEIIRRNSSDDIDEYPDLDAPLTEDQKQRAASELTVTSYIYGQEPQPGMLAVRDAARYFANHHSFEVWSQVTAPSGGWIESPAWESYPQDADFRVERSVPTLGAALEIAEAWARRGGIARIYGVGRPGEVDQSKSLGRLDIMEVAQNDIMLGDGFYTFDEVMLMEENITYAKCDCGQGLDHDLLPGTPIQWLGTLEQLTGGRT